MGKKRVFELAKELGYQNRDLIEKLQKLGFDVKSHSSTIDEDEVRAGLRRADDDKKAKTDERRISNVVIRRRAKDDEPSAPAPVAASPAVARRSGDSGPARPASASVVVRRRAPAESTEAVVEGASAVETVEEASEAATVDVSSSIEPSGEETTQEVAVSAEVLAASEAAEGEPVVEAKSDDEDPERREARAARPDRKREEDYDEEDEKPDVEDLGISESDFMVKEREVEVNVVRVAPPPPSTVAQPKKDEQTQSRVMRQIDPNVLKARLTASKRPEPPKDWGKQVAASPVTELVVRTDASGKRKELVDVRGEEAKGKGGRAGQRRREEISAKDLLEHRRGQVYYPAPNRKKVRGSKGRPGKGMPMMPALEHNVIHIGDTITVADLSQQMSRKATEIIGYLMRNGVMANINMPIDHETAAMVCAEFGYEVKSSQVVEQDLLDDATENVTDASKLAPRPPVVTVMGHVDHGKTSLLDRIRKTNVAGGEAGGITQRIAGYQVTTSKGPITFLDTPGHAAFTAMRARGANVTDVVVLVVAADDGVMPQTKEAIDHAKAANVPIIVAINKMDKPDANPDQVLRQLADVGVIVEEWGGTVLSRKISAKTGAGIDELLELVALQTEIMELKANPEAPAVATVVEGHIHKGRGPVATVLVQEGTLRVGDVVVVGENTGRIRAMMGDGGKNITEAGPAVPVEVLGLEGVPNPGDKLRVANDLDSAKELASHRRDKRRSTELGTNAKVSLQDLFARVKMGDQKELRIIIKADLQGTVEALKQALTDLSTPKVKVNVISGGVGTVTESDVEFAKASAAIIVGFATRPDTKALKAARTMDVDIRSYDIIYEAVDEVKLAMRGLLAPVSKEKYLGRAEVRQTFNVPKTGTIAGCAVVDGSVQRSANVRVLREGKIMFDGKLSSLKRFKDDAREVKEGLECGMGIEKFNDLKVGDLIEAYEVILTEAVLDEAIVKGPSGSEART